MKKLVSMLLVLAMLVTVFAGLAITASAADAALTVYTQAGADGEKTLAKSYTAEELKKLAETKADGYGYQYFKKGEQDVVVTEYVTLDTLLTDADVSFADGDSLAFVCDDGPYTKFNPTYKDITEGKYSFKDGKGEEVPAAIALVWGNGAAADGTVADIDKTAEDTGSNMMAHPHVVDIYMGADSYNECILWGAQNVEVYIRATADSETAQ